MPLGRLREDAFSPYHVIQGGLWTPLNHVRQQHPHSSLTSLRHGREGRRRTTGKNLGSATRRGDS
jgi:hypothetical protein